ncbi:MAG: hypothetical protein AABZ55_10335 [Bdellovibrionota bacterium]
MVKTVFGLLLIPFALSWGADPQVTCRVALVPGAFGSGTSSIFLKAEDYFKEFTAYFEKLGCDVFQVEFPPDATIEVRSLMLRDQVDRRNRMKPIATKTWIVAHSQGGLDARFALRSLKLGGVRGLITIGTPHQGTSLADWVIQQKSHRSFYYWVTKTFGYDLGALPFLGEMTSTFLKKHADRFSPVAGIDYFSARGRCQTHCHFGFKLLKWITGAPDGDGIVPWASQIWGQDIGEYDLDHIQEVGVDPEKIKVRANLLLKFGQLITTSNSASRSMQSR